MTAMSISQDSGAVDSDRAEAEEAEEEGTSNSTGKHHKCGTFLLLLSFILNSSSFRGIS